MNTDEQVETMRQVLGDALAKQMGIGYYYVTAETARAALAVVPMTEWQPIETAPKDGTRVLLWRRAIRDQPAPIMADGFWCETCWVWPYILSEPTHWQPLPAPPERAGK